jgi:hypothetical protein
MGIHRRVLLTWALLSSGCAISSSGDADVGPGDRGPDRDAATFGCALSADCRDDNPCTDDRCSAGACEYVPMTRGTACGDEDRCNGVEQCDGNGACEPGAPVDCGASDACTAVTCVPSTGQCVTERTPDCCTRDDQCGPSFQCETAVCDPTTNRCVLEPIIGCCQRDADCPAAQCERAVCDRAARRCGVERVEGCCTGNADCPADFECVQAQCVAVPDPPACCVTDEDCPGVDGCTRYTCRGVVECCVPERIEGCCEADGDCGPGRACDRATQTCAEALVEFGALQFPLAPIELCPGLEMPRIFARVYAPDVTTGAGMGIGIEAEFGYGEAGTDARVDPDWGYFPGVYNGDLLNEFREENDDEYRVDLPAPAVGDWRVVARFRLRGGPWLYADQGPRGTADGFSLDDLLPVRVSARCGPPPPPVGFAAFQFPLAPVTVCAGEASPMVFLRVYIDGVTPGAGRGAFGDLPVQAALGYGPVGSDPAVAPDWVFVAAEYNGDLDSPFGVRRDDEYRAQLPSVPAGEFDLAWRVGVAEGAVVYADLPPNGTNDGYASATTLRLTGEMECGP